MSVAHSTDLYSYIVKCGSCGHDYDAILAPWCHCVTKEIAVACPQCESCVCRDGRKAIRDFWFHAPELLIQLRSEEMDRRKAAPAWWGKPAATILIVDDDEEIRLIAAYELQSMGYRTFEAGSPAEALEIVDRNRPDMVLTDALMPGGDGREMCRLIKLRHPRVRVAVMTSLYTAPRYATEAYRTFHADAYLAKPIELDKLRSVAARLAGPAAVEVKS